MKTGSDFLRVDHLISALLVWALLFISAPATADAPYDVHWESRWSEETKDGEIIDSPPIVSVNNVRLYKFSQMQSVTWRDTLEIEDGGDAYEKLYVFTVWQGGASQGEQLMLLSVKNDGIAVIGPYEQDFETLEIEQFNSESAPEFALMGGDGAILAHVTYTDGYLTGVDG